MIRLKSTVFIVFGPDYVFAIKSTSAYCKPLRNQTNMPKKPKFSFQKKQHCGLNVYSVITVPILNYKLPASWFKALLYSLKVKKSVSFFVFLDCPRGKFLCSCGGCIDKSMRCDGFINCDDRSDELGCTGQKKKFRLHFKVIIN